MIDLNLNGRNVAVDVDTDMPLLWVLRDVLGLTGTKYGCGRHRKVPCRIRTWSR